MIEKCLAEIEKDEKLGFVYTNTRYFGEYNFVYRRQEYNFYDLLLANYIVATSLFRKKAWEDVGGYDENMKEGYEDWEFFIRLGKKGWHGRLIEEPLFFYRKHGKSVNYDARKQHDSIVEYIRGKHRNLYSKEGLLKIKKEWDEKNIFSSIYKKIIKELLSIRIKLILAGILDGDDWKSYPFRTLGRCVPIRIKEIINKVFGKEILDTKYFRRNL
jgi:GT2 family glycosyltransferase